MRHERVAGVASALPTSSLARTVSLWSPVTSAGVVNGLAHAVNTGVSIAHSYVAPASDENRNSTVGVATLVPSAGPEVIVVSGGVRSTVQARGAVSAAWPSVSVPRSVNVCGPSARSE